MNSGIREVRNSISEAHNFRVGLLDPRESRDPGNQEFGSSKIRFTKLLISLIPGSLDPQGSKRALFDPPGGNMALLDPQVAQ